MANVYVGNDVLYNILQRLPGKPLLRFRCASKHWNGLISDPSFMKSRSRRMILFPFLLPLVGIDDNVPVEDEAHSIIRIPSPFKHMPRFSEVTTIGTFNGIVLLAVSQNLRMVSTTMYLWCDLILYNPLTRASKVIVSMKHESFIGNVLAYVFGFCHGETTDDLKIVRFDFMCHMSCYEWDIFDLKTSSWSISQGIERDFQFWGNAGVFVNGFLYWVITRQQRFNILALNVKEMEFSKIKLPEGLDPEMLLLGSIGGCLYTISSSYDTTGFDVWLMREQCDENSWTKAHSFKFGLEGNRFYPICILGNGKIFMTSSSIQLVIYDTSKDSYKTLNALESRDHFERICEIFCYKPLYGNSEFRVIRSIEYVESLVSPSYMCFI